MTVSRTALRAALINPNVRALQAVIRAGLGTPDAIGYRSLFGGGFFEDVSWHPARRVTVVVDGRPMVSTAAGAYRILNKTWDGLVNRYGFEDFSPACQDEASVALVALCGALPDILDGRLALALDKCATVTEWACLPGSPYGAPDEPGATALTMDRAIEIYHSHGGRLGPPMPQIERPPAPAAVVAPTPPPRRPRSLRPLMVGLAVAALLMAWVLRAKGGW